MGCGHYVKNEAKTKRDKFTIQIGRCASMKEVEGTLVVEEINGNYVLSVVSRFGVKHALHEFIPQCLINKKVRVKWDGESILIKEAE